MSVLPDMRHGNITVIGDVMLDRFWSGASRRVGPEAPVPVVNVSGQEDRAGARVMLRSISRNSASQSRWWVCAVMTSMPER